MPLRLIDLYTDELALLDRLDPNDRIEDHVALRVDELSEAEPPPTTCCSTW